jgi:hypothetical protein
MNELTKKIMCIKMRDGVELWIEDDRIDNLKSYLKSLTGTKFIEIGSEMINSADITGIYEATTMAEVVRRRNGEWKCKKGNWHAKGEDCRCGWSNTEDWEEPKTGESTGKGLEALRNTVQEMRNSL